MALPADQAPPRVVAVLFSTVFGLLAAVALHSLCRTRGHRAHHAHHLVAAAAMVYLTAGATHGGGPPAHGAGVPALTLALLGYFAAYALRNGPRLVTVAAAGPAGPAGSAGDGPLTAPALVAACRVGMAMSTFAMLLTM